MITFSYKCPTCGHVLVSSTAESDVFPWCNGLWSTRTSSYHTSVKMVRLPERDYHHTAAWSPYP